MASETEARICAHFKTGFCKHRENCRNLHVTEICNKVNCDRTCQNRHPHVCRYFSLWGRCKFNDSCAYLHQLASDPVLLTLQEEIQSLKRKVEEMNIQVNALQKKDLSLDLQTTTESLALVGEPTARALAVDNLPAIPQLDGFVNDAVEHIEAESTSHDQIIDYTCETCDLEFDSEEDFLEHDAYQFNCDICLICFDAREALNEHVQDFHPKYKPARIRRIRNGEAPI